MGSARDERALLADVIEAAGPDHPTLCEGWDTYDLVAHLVTRERVPKASPGLIIPRLHGITERAEKATRTARPFPELLTVFRSGPPAWQPSRIRAFDDATNLVEFFVHGEDVRRGGAPGAVPARELSPELREKLWASVRRMARLSYRRVPFGLVLERTDSLERTDGTASSVSSGPSRVVARKGEPAVTLRGPAAELLLYGFGRRAAAQIEVTGDPGLIATLEKTPLGL
ncbi:TIGR03085 family metal-binding protein [Pseudofrankia inefficax]|nr:TIGR03085 family metal-binding protein [Pseudofrankia inefficax]